MACRWEEERGTELPWAGGIARSGTKASLHRSCLPLHLQVHGLASVMGRYNWKDGRVHQDDCSTNTRHPHHEGVHRFHGLLYLSLLYSLATRRLGLPINNAFAPRRSLMNSQSRMMIRSLKEAAQTLDTDVHHVLEKKREGPIPGRRLDSRVFTTGPLSPTAHAKRCRRPAPA